MTRLKLLSLNKFWRHERICKQLMEVFGYVTFQLKPDLLRTSRSTSCTQYRTILYLLSTNAQASSHDLQIHVILNHDHAQYLLFIEQTH